MILVIDNYDSFTYNLVHYLNELGADTVVHRNDDLSVQEALGLRPNAVLLSPGPKAPDQAGICLPLLRGAPEDLAILGVCLGHQAIGQAYGGDVIRAKEVMHGKTSKIFHNDQGVFKGLPNPFIATRYHSLAVDKATLPADLEITAWTEDGEIMIVSIADSRLNARSAARLRRPFRSASGSSTRRASTGVQAAGGPVQGRTPRSGWAQTIHQSPPRR